MTYDANGNRTSTTSTLRGINNQTATYSAEDYTLTAGDNTYTFNVDGYLQSKTTSGGTSVYNYSATGQLLSATLENGKTIEYVYDSLGRRIAKKVNGQIVEKYQWLELITLLAVYDANDTLVYRFNYASGRMPDSMEYSGQTYYLAYDQVGSLRVVTDTAGNVIKRTDYDSFGSIFSDSNPSFNVPFGFAGGLQDRDTGLVRFGVRDYDPSIGKWTAKDPIDFKGGDTNLFNYISSDPVNWIDPLGLAQVDISGFLKLRQQLFGWAPDWVQDIIMSVDPTIGPLTMESTGSKVTKACKAVSKSRSINELWKEFKSFPDKWKKIEEWLDPKQPAGGKSIREIWENIETGERIGIHDKTPTSTTRKGIPKHPHPFDPAGE